MDNLKIPEGMMDAVRKALGRIPVVINIESNCDGGVHTILNAAIEWLDVQIHNIGEDLRTPSPPSFMRQPSLGEINAAAGASRAINRVRKLFVPAPVPFDHFLNCAEDNAPADVDRIDLYSSSGSLLASRKVVR